MKKLLMTFFLFMALINTAWAPPGTPTAYVEIAKPIIYYSNGMYEPLMEAIYTYESTRNPLAYNKMENACGGFQIRPKRIEHYNNLNGTNYTVEDCYDLQISRKVFLYFTNHNARGQHIPNKSWEQAAKDWNGSGKMTIAYWEEVKKRI